MNLDFSFDPNTNNRLQVIPPGSLASIRLGNWRTGGEAESITYTYTVDSMAYILLLKYAVVLEDPSGHGHDVMPLFALDILDSRGNVIDANCGSAEFVPGTNTAGWNTMSGGVWKDWTEVGLNLQQYVGQTIKVRLLTKDCDWSGHYGYAYFTLDCGKGSLDGVSCGDVIPDSVCAPEGFVYEWAQRIDPTNVVSTNRCIIPKRGDTAE